MSELVKELTFIHAVIWEREIRFVVMYREIHKISPPHLTHPGWHLLNTHLHRVTHSWKQMPYTGAVGSHSQRPGSKGGLALGHLSHGKEVDWHPSSCQFHQSFEWRERESNHQPSGFWTTNSNHWATAAKHVPWPGIQPGPRQWECRIQTLEWVPHHQLFS